MTERDERDEKTHELAESIFDNADNWDITLEELDADLLRYRESIEAPLREEIKRLCAERNRSLQFRDDERSVWVARAEKAEARVKELESEIERLKADLAASRSTSAEIQSAFNAAHVACGGDTTRDWKARVKELEDAATLMLYTLDRSDEAGFGGLESAIKRLHDALAKVTR